MELLKDNLLRSKSLCDCKNVFRHQFSNIFSFTTENISGYLEYFDFNNKSLLTVGSSGDQILNSFYCGARNITLFDINEYAKYYVYLKIAAIASLNYKDFQDFFFKRVNAFNENELMFSKTFFKKLKNTLKIFDYESFYFFDELFNSFKGKVIRDRMFNDAEYRNRVIKGFNIYLHSENNYNRLKSIIENINFKYINGNLFKDEIEGRYDNIFLSNLCTVVDIYKFFNLVKRINDNNLNINGSMLFAYLWDIQFESDSFEEDWKDIYKMPLVKKFFKDYITEYHQIKNDSDILFEQDYKKDLVLIYRKK